MQLVSNLNSVIINNTGIEVRRAKSQVDLDACLRVRHKVFTMEQGIDSTLDDDGLDQNASHYLAVDHLNNPLGTARAVIQNAVAKIGRVAVLKSYRKHGIGAMMMQFVISDVYADGFRECVLGSQLYAIPFYERLGFVVDSPEFMNAGIPHKTMRLFLPEQGRAV